MNKFFSSMKYLGYGMQLTAGVLTPIFLCIFGGGYLKEKFALGDWFIAVCVLLALGLAGAEVYRFGKRILNEIKKQSRGNAIAEQSDKK